LSNFDILTYAKKLHIPYFRGVFMRDTLPKKGPKLRQFKGTWYTLDMLYENRFECRILR